MNFRELKTALQSNEVEITDTVLRAFVGTFAEDELREQAAILRGCAPRAHRIEWFVDRKLDSSALLSIADNYEWAASEIERLSKAAA